MNELIQAIRETTHYYETDTEGFCDFDIFTDEHQADLAANYLVHVLQRNANEALEDIDPRDFAPSLKKTKHGIDYAEIGKIVVKSMVSHCQISIQNLIDEELRSNAA